MTVLVLWSWLVVAVGIGALWLIQVRTKDATSVDVAWSAALGMLAITYALFADGDPLRRGLVGTMAALWAFRLAYYLLVDRVLKASTEDGRYRAMREYWGSRAQFWFFWFYQGQAAVAVLFSLPILTAMQGGVPELWALVGALIWVIAVTGETIADRQLARHRADPANRGQVCQIGLWRYSRHPNYFFEWLHWWTYVLISRGSLLTWLGPIAMLIFLFRLTGIPYTEQQALRSRGEGYRSYQRTTSVFFPWFPKKESA
jgi:steroid 5-alpha reductase family enzyme